jgi:hypothetical protein
MGDLFRGSEPGSRFAVIDRQTYKLGDTVSDRVAASLRA